MTKKRYVLLLFILDLLAAISVYSARKSEIPIESREETCTTVIDDGATNKICS